MFRLMRVYKLVCLMASVAQMNRTSLKLTGMHTALSFPASLVQETSNVSLLLSERRCEGALCSFSKNILIRSERS